MTRTSGSEHTSIEIGDLNQQLVVSSIQEKLCATSPLPARCCIFRVPFSLRNHNKNAFEPNLVSIGPFHHGKRELKAMESVKLWYLHCLLTRSPTPVTSLDHFVEVISEKEPYYRGCYAEQFNLSRDEFVEMMVVDGCFVIELFRKRAGLVSRDEDDPLFNMSWMYLPLKIDLLLLENQLPWTVLESLWTLTETNGEPASNWLCLSSVIFFRDNMLTRSPTANATLRNKHLLDFLRNCLLSSFADKKLEETVWDPIPSVTELLQSGVEFKLGDADDMLNIKFIDGVMEIPPIFIQANAESLLGNLIALEQCDSSLNNKITSYAIILDYLINSSKDVDILHEKKIVYTALSSEDVAGFFNRLPYCAGVYNFTYKELCRQVNAYHGRSWHRWKATLRRDYFGNPWSIMSFLAAVFILLLTFLQTIFGIRYR